MGTALERSESQTGSRAEGGELRDAGVAVDGMDVLAVEAAARAAAPRCAAAAGPMLPRVRTYRFRAHSMFDPELYRDKAEVEEWKQRDPILALRARGCARQRLLDDADAGGASKRTVAAEIDAAVAFAEAGTCEPVADLDRVRLRRARRDGR